MVNSSSLVNALKIPLESRQKPQTPNCDFVSGISYVKPTVTFEARLCFLIFREENFHPFPFERHHFLVK